MGEEEREEEGEEEEEEALSPLSVFKRESEDCL